MHMNTLNFASWTAKPYLLWVVYINWKLENGMLAMLWSLIKIPVTYCWRHSNRSVLVLICLLADPQGVNVISAAYMNFLVFNTNASLRIADMLPKMSTSIDTHYWGDVHMCNIVDINVLLWNLKALLIISIFTNSGSKIIRFMHCVNSVVVFVSFWA